MDGLTVLQAVIGGINVISKIYETAEKLHNAPGCIRDLMSELLVTRRILEQLRPLVVDTDEIESEGAQYVKLGDLVLVFTDLAKTLSSFDKFTSQICSRGSLKGNVLFKSPAWVNNEQKFERNLTRLQHHKSSLTVMLALLERLALQD